MSQTKRYPLGLPKGSVRAVLALAVFGTVMLLLLQDRNIDQSLWMVNYIVLGYYFASRQAAGPTIQAPTATPSPLHLPRGTVRWTILLSFIGTCVYLVWSWEQGTKHYWEHSAFFPLLSLTGFFLGRLFQGVTQWLTKGGEEQSKFFQLFADGKALMGLLSAASIIVIVLLGVKFSGSDYFFRSSTIFILFYFGSR